MAAAVSDSPTTRKNATTLSVIHNLWYHGNMFYAIRPSGDPTFGQAKISPAQQLHLYSSTDLATTFMNVMAISFPDTVLMVEHPYNGYKDDLVFWTEVVIGIVNTVSNSSLPEYLNSVPIAKLLFSNVMANEVSQWALDLTKLALGLSTVPVEAKGKRVEILFHDDLEMVNATYWLHMSQVLLPHQRYHSAELVAGFYTPQIARSFRHAAYDWAASGQDSDQVQEPRFITFLTYAAGDGKRDVTNKEEVMQALHEVAESRALTARHLAVSNTTATDFLIRSMQETSILVARSSSALANLIFLAAGASVVELLPFNWVVQDLDKLYKNVTASVGDLRYCSWTATEARFCDYDSAMDGRFSKFTADECTESKSCVEVHHAANMIVDIPALKATITNCLGLAGGGVLAGAQTAQQ